MTYRSFKQSARGNLRGISEDEFVDAIKSLQEDYLGFVRTVHVPQTADPVTECLLRMPQTT